VVTTLDTVMQIVIPTSSTYVMPLTRDNNQIIVASCLGLLSQNLELVPYKVLSGDTFYVFMNTANTYNTVLEPSVSRLR
jgi:hypothetical protein